MEKRKRSAGLAVSIYFLLVSIVLIGQAQAALISPMSQDRTTSARVRATTSSGGSGGDYKSGSTTDFGVFDSTVTAMGAAKITYCRMSGCYDTTAGGGSATGVQHSEIAGNSILANGTASWNIGGGLPTIQVLSEGSASSIFSVTFDVVQDATFSLAGNLSNFLSWSGSTDPVRSQARVDLTGTSTIAHYALDSSSSTPGSLSFSDSALLAAGRYTLSAAAMSNGVALDSYNNGNSNYSFQLTLVPVPVPLPAALWLFASAIAVISRSGLRRRPST